MAQALQQALDAGTKLVHNVREEGIFRQDRKSRLWKFTFNILHSTAC